MTQRETAKPSAANQIIRRVRKGFPSQRIDQLAQSLAVDRSTLLGVLGISERTLLRKQIAARRLSATVSDRLARVDRLFALATEVFGGREKAAHWLVRSSRALGDEVPLQLLDTDAGSQKVEQELRQIQFGFVY